MNEAELCPNAYGDSDFVDLKNSVNAEIEGLVKFEEGKGYNGYTIDFNALIGVELSKTIALSEFTIPINAKSLSFFYMDKKFFVRQKVYCAMKSF